MQTVCIRLLTSGRPKISLYVPLLASTNKPYVRQFAAESFAFLLRKVKAEKLSDALALLTAHADTSGDTDGLSTLVFETIKVCPLFHHPQCC